MAASAAVAAVVSAALVFNVGEHDRAGREVAQPSTTPSLSATTSPSGESSSPGNPSLTCTAYPPNHLPDGSPTGAGQQLGNDKWTWGEGANRVTQLVGADELTC